MPEFNLFINDFNKLREFSRKFYIYGCYSRDDIKKFNISPRKYDDELRRIKILLNQEQNLGKYKISKKQFQYIKEEFIRKDNPLINIYFSKTFTKNEISAFILIHQILYKYKEGLTFQELIEKCSNIDNNSRHFIDFSETTFRRILKRMVEYGYIVELDENGKIYKLGHDLLHFLKLIKDKEQLEIFLNIIDYYTNTLHPSVPGYYLKETIENTISYFLKQKQERNIFRYIYNNHHQVLDEEYVWQFLIAISLFKKVFIKYQTNKNGIQEFNCIPIKVILDRKFGRWYFIVLKEDKKISALPVHRVQDIEILDSEYSKDDLNEYEKLIDKCFFVSIPSSKNKFISISLHFKLDKEGNNFLLKRVKRELKGAKIKNITEDSFDVDYSLSNIKEIKPWLLSFGHRVIVKNTESSQELTQELVSELKEMLQNYESLC
ncbi:helix-turn-helix transcriptional regulator [Caldicellulosiruptoraceae bacterium PP1]